MKILYAAAAVNHEGGVPKMLALQANHFAALGHSVCILTQNGSSIDTFYEFDARIQWQDISYSGFKPAFLFQYQKAVRSVLRDFSPDVTIVVDNGFKAFLLPLLADFKTPLVLALHRSRYNRESSDHGIFGRWKAKSFDVYQRYLARKFDSVVVLSQAAQREWNLTATIIPNPVVVAAGRPSDPNKKIAICAARYAHEKGIDRLLDIWQKVHRTHPDWQLHVYGSGQKTAFERQAQRLGIGASVTLSGPVADIHERFRSASVYVLASRFEAFPLSLIEAMACGLGAVAYDCPSGPASIIQNGANGWLIADGDADAFARKLSEVLSSAAERERIGVAAAASVRHLTPENALAQWEALLSAWVGR